jgi:hypothetical protein
LREVRQPLVPTPGGDDREARRARPVDEIADERRLVAVGEAVHDARLLRLLREERAAERVGLHGHHHHVLAVPERGERVLDRRDRIAGRLDHDLDLRIGDELLPVVRDRRLLDQLLRPAHSPQVRLRVRRREVRDADKPHPRCPRHLREVHRRELARADQADAQRVLFPLLQLCVEVHAAFSSSLGVPFFQGSGTS